MSAQVNSWTPQAVRSDITTFLTKLDASLIDHPDTKLGDFPSVDSFAMLSLAIEIEQYFSISFSGEELQSFGDLTRDALAELVCEKLGARIG